MIRGDVAPTVSLHCFLFCRKLWDAVSGDELQSFAHKHIVKTVAFSSDTNHLLTGSNEKLLRVFDLNNTDSGESGRGGG